MAVYRIGQVRIDLETRQIARAGEPVALEPRAFDALVYLIDNRTRVVSKDELIREVWRDRIVTDGAVAQAINKIRRVFGGDTQSVISTSSRVGYRFVGSIDSNAEGVPWIKWLGVTAAATALVVALILPWRDRAAPPPNSIAVLPLLDLSADQSLGYFGDGLADELLTELARLPDLRVVARTSSFALRGKEMDAREIGTVLGVAAVIEGSLRVEDDRLRITAQLINTADGMHLWTDSYDRDYAQLIELQRQIATDIAIQLRARITDSAGTPLLSTPTSDLNAYESYLQGRALWQQRDHASLRRAIELFQEAIRADPGFARAYEALASAYIVLPEWAPVSRPDVEALAISAAREALRLDDRLGEARAILAAQAARDGDWIVARELYREAISREPSNPTLLHWYASFLIQVGQSAEAVAPAERALRLDPLSRMTHTVKAWAALLNDDLDGAWEHANQAVARGLPTSKAIAAAAAFKRGDKGLAATLLSGLPDPPDSLEACAAALRGEAESARAALKNDPREDSLALVYRTLCMGMLGYADDALALHATQPSWSIAGGLLWLPEFSGIRNADAFDALMTRHRLVEYWQESKARGGGENR